MCLLGKNCDLSKEREKDPFHVLIKSDSFQTTLHHELFSKKKIWPNRDAPEADRR